MRCSLAKTTIPHLILRRFNVTFAGALVTYAVLILLIQSQPKSHVTVVVKRVILVWYAQKHVVETKMKRNQAHATAVVKKGIFQWNAKIQPRVKLHQAHASDVVKKNILHECKSLLKEATVPRSCYKCGGGHFTRECKSTAKKRKQHDDDEEEHKGINSEPKRKKQDKDKKITTSQKPRSSGGSIRADPREKSFRQSNKNGWRSPKEPSYTGHMTKADPGRNHSDDPIRTVGDLLLIW